jgi:hypothetical protein
MLAVVVFISWFPLERIKVMADMAYELLVKLSPALLE